MLFSTYRMNTASELQNPNGVLANSNKPAFVTNAVYF